MRLAYVDTEECQPPKGMSKFYKPITYGGKGAAEFLKDHQDMMVCNVSALMDELKRCPGKVKPSWAKNAAPWPHAYPPT